MQEPIKFVAGDISFIAEAPCGTQFNVTFVTSSVNEANVFCEQNEDSAVLAEVNGVIFVASVIPK